MNQITEVKKHNERVKRSKLECPVCNMPFISRKAKSSHVRLIHKRGKHNVREQTTTT